MKKLFIFIFILSMTMTGCSNKQLYKNGQSYYKNDCINHSTSDAQYVDCMKQPTTPYKEYEKERKELLEGKEKDESKQNLK